MKNLNALSLLLISLFLFASTALCESRDESVINAFIAKQAIRESGEEFKDARKVIEADVNGDGSLDLTVLYTIEGQNGSNNYIQYLAVFVRKKGKLVPVTHITVGGKLLRSVDLVSVTRGVIMMNTLNYAAQDPACCPSKKGKARYVLINGKLKKSYSVANFNSEDEKQ